MITELDNEPILDHVFSENVTILRKPNKTYYIVGTAHVSQKSVEEVAHVIQSIKPDTVCVELCQTRFQAITEENQWAKLNIAQVIKQGKALMLLASLALSSFQRKMGEKLGVKPGSELMEGVNQAKAVGAQLVLADRDIQTTLKRTWANLGFFKKAVVISGLVESVLSSEEISAEELEKMKESDHLSDMMQEFARTMPDVKKPLIDERDQFLMSMIEEAPGETIVAVVGAGHVKGMTHYFGKTVDREAINVVPPPSIWAKIMTWLFPVLFVGLFVWGLMGLDMPAQEMTITYLLPILIGTALFAAIAGGHPLSVIAGALSSPLTLIHPLLSSGMVAGLVEALIRKPTVADCERIPDDITSFRGFYKNPFTRTLLVLILTNIGTTLGFAISVGWFISLFK